MKFTCRHCDLTVLPDWQYCEQCGKKLPLKTNQKRLKTAALIAQFQRQNAQQIREHWDIYESVTLIAIPRGCDICQRDQGRPRRRQEIVDVPHPGCDCDDDCACSYIGHVKPLPELLK